MQTKFKRHQKVKLLHDPDPEYIEYDVEHVDSRPPIKKGMSGKINVLLTNGQYHVEIIDENEKTLAYAPMAEESLEAIE
jgi:hypothetical protein